MVVNNVFKGVCFASTFKDILDKSRSTRSYKISWEIAVPHSKSAAQ